MLPLKRSSKLALAVIINIEIGTYPRVGGVVEDILGELHPILP